MEPTDDTNQSVPGEQFGEDGAGTHGEASDEWQDAGATAGRHEQTQRARDAAQQWLAQLQSMIDNASRQAGPVLRDVAAKAAELAAVAAENAGPVAHKAAEVTDKVGGRVAARSKEFAADLRRQAGDDKGGDDEGTGDTGASI